jgi:transcriptional regulator with XRE-family HTH domain
MSTAPQAHVPPITLGWRLKIALSHGGIKAEHMADALDVSRQTVSRWMSDKGAPPKRVYLKEWAEATGVPLQWLETGAEPCITPPPNGGKGGRKTSAELAAEKGRRAQRPADPFTPGYLQLAA